MLQQQIKIIHKYNKFRSTGGPPYLNDMEVKFLLEYFNDLMDKLMPLERYSLAVETAARDWYSLHLIASARRIL